MLINKKIRMEKISMMIFGKIEKKNLFHIFEEFLSNNNKDI